MKQKTEKIQEITTNIHRLGMTLQLINDWSWEEDTDFENNVEFRLIHTSLSLATFDDRLDNPKIWEMLGIVIVVDWWDYQDDDEGGD